MIAAAMAAGALLLLGPALLKTRFDVDEVVTTLLLNFIVLLFVSMMLDGPMKDPTAMGWPQSVALQAGARVRQARRDARACTRDCCRRGLPLALLLLWHRPRSPRSASRCAPSARNARAAAFAGMPVSARRWSRRRSCRARSPGSPGASRSPGAPDT